MHFCLIEPRGVATDPIAAELELLPLATRPVAQLWSTRQCLVVPRSYRQFTGYEAARADFGARGCPVFERPSGGGLVPLGPGFLTLSLAYPLPGPPGQWMEAVYLHLCRLLQQALRGFGMETHWQAVSGSFCDGRFNLASGTPNQARKIAGTAQYWRRLPASAEPGAPSHAVLAHAVLLVEPDLSAAHAWANGFEQAIGSGRRYDPARTVSVAQMLGRQARSDLLAQVTQALSRALQHAEPPGLAP
ncbi:MAG TPA: lipoate--protein ligase family protein [Ottowia sp.]|uniref:lipoyl protein ligase domain-containing protein n=1 Tax=Ottowia sp. TaxID=1898956 RepID=UPI002D00817E|nr:lipoate--protein ligase family protein [Ottowia sp.]HMN20497.1 lipoate--protein ligase family protein [Ottowia sp.]